MAIIALTGHKQSGKDTVGKIIQYLIIKNNHLDRSSDYFTTDYNNFLAKYNEYNGALPNVSHWQIKRFADKLKQCASIILNIPVEDFEKEEVKNRVLWNTYRTMPTFNYIGQSTGERKEIVEFTCRMFLQQLGTEVSRNIKQDIWINTLLNEYYITHYLYGDTPYILQKDGMYRPADLNHNGMSEQDMIYLHCNKVEGYNWIITDTRYLNEAKVIKDKQGIIIRVVRDTNKSIDPHTSEVEQDKIAVDYTINNNSTIEDLINEVKVVLTDLKII